MTKSRTGLSKLVYGLLIVVMAIMLFSCEKVASPEEPVNPEPPPDEPVLPPLPEDPYAIFQNTGSDENAGWMVLTASMPSPDGEINDVYRHIYLVDYNDPTNYRRIAGPDPENEDDHRLFIYPSFFPDRDRILYQEYPAESFWVYNVAMDTTICIWSEGLGGARYHVFSPDQAGFYFATYNDWTCYDIVFHRFSDKSIVYLTMPTPDLRSYNMAVGMIGADTLIVRSDEMFATGDLPGLYFMSTDGEFLSRVENPYLDTYLEDDAKRGYFTWDAVWNEELRLFAIGKVQSDERHIFVTNLDGTYYHQFTSGPYKDYGQVWGPGGGVLLFMRKDVGEDAYRIMKLNLKTGETSLFVDPAVIDGAIELMYPHY